MIMVMVPMAGPVAVVSGMAIAASGNGKAGEHQSGDQRELTHLLSPE
jgi:hypothetical protein